MSNKHTPGPWEAISNLVRTRCTPDGNGGFLIAECPPNIGSRLENARLIAAAPELLEACKMAEGAINRSVSGMKSVSIPEWGALIAVMQRAIAKATGSAV